MSEYITFYFTPIIDLVTCLPLEEKLWFEYSSLRKFSNKNCCQFSYVTLPLYFNNNNKQLMAL
jgi:hypothetical protein